jgi:predicted TIM-barrel fold metal-dependent hydrolase
MGLSQLIDCHVHILDARRFPYGEGPGYRPLPHESGTEKELTSVLDRAGVGHALLVQPSCYGFDNSALLHAMRVNAGRFRGIAMVAPDTSEKNLVTLSAAGVIGVRFNLLSYDRDAFRRPGTDKLLQRVHEMGWFAEVVADAAQWSEITPMLLRCRATVLIDHFGMPRVTQWIDQDGFRAVLRLGSEGRAVVKLTTPFALDLPRGDQHLLDPFVLALLDAFGVENCVWGSDWPFLAVRNPPRYGDALGFVDHWLPDPLARQRVLWDNPIRLFGFNGTSHA